MAQTDFQLTFAKTIAATTFEATVYMCIGHCRTVISSFHCRAECIDACTTHDSQPDAHTRRSKLLFALKQELTVIMCVKSIFSVCCDKINYTQTSFVVISISSKCVKP